VYTTDTEAKYTYGRPWDDMLCHHVEVVRSSHYFSQSDLDDDEMSQL